MPKAVPLEDAFVEALPSSLKTLLDGIRAKDKDLVRAGLGEFFAAFPRLTPKELGERLSKGERAIEIWKSEGRGPKEQILPELYDLYCELKDAYAGAASMEEVRHVREDLSFEVPQRRIRVGMAPVWDAAIFAAFDSLSIVRGVHADYGYLQGWSADAFYSLFDRRHDVLLHNRFLLTAAKYEDPYLDLCMSHPLYIYKGQFVFVRRDYIDNLVRNNATNARLREEFDEFLSTPYDLYGPHLSFPRLSSPEAKRLVLDCKSIEPAYLAGTDHEEVMRQLYEIAFKSDVWEERSLDYKCHKDQVVGKRRANVKELANGFTAENPTYNVFVGGIPFFWEFAKLKESPYLPLCDPLELHIPSLNGLVVSDKARQDPDFLRSLDSIAWSCFAAANLLLDWFQSLDYFPDKREVVGDLLAKEHLLHVKRIAMAAPLTDRAINSGEVEIDIITGREVDEITSAWAWTRLLLQYVDFFTSARQANSVRSSTEMRHYANCLQRLMERRGK